MKTNILTLVVTLTLGIILAGSLLMPVVNSAIEDNQTTLLNNTGIKWHMVEADETVTASWDGTTCTINGDSITYGPTYSFISADSFYCRWAGTAVVCGIYDYENDTAITYYTWSLTASDGTMTVTNLADDTQTQTVEYTWLFIPTTTEGATSDWVMTNGNADYYLTDDSEIYIASSDGLIVIEGKFSDLKVTSDGEAADYEITATPVDGYEQNVYKFTKIVITAFNGTDYTFNRLILPTSITVTNEGTEVYNTLYATIPVMVILALVVAALGAIYTKRDD